MEIQSSAAQQMHFPGIVAIRCCTGCQQGKSLTIEFFYCHKSNRAGFDTRCRDCRNGTLRAWRAANAERINARRRELYALKKSSALEENHRGQTSAQDGEARHSDGEESSGNSIKVTHDIPLVSTGDGADEFIKIFGISGDNNTIPEPAESDDPDQNATGGVLIPSMVAEQSGELDAGETATVGASAVLPPAYLAPGDPASVEGAIADARGHAPPAFLSDEIDDDEAGRRRALAAIAAGEAVEGSVVRDLVGIGYVHATPTRLIVTDEGRAWLESVAAERIGVEPSKTGDFSPILVTEEITETPPFLCSIPMDRSDNTVEGKHGGTSDAVPDARPAASPDGRASTYPDGWPVMPEFLLRKKRAA